MIELGLERISQLLASQTLPVTWRAIHVAGTNGKGSVCSFVSEMLNAYNRSRFRKKRGHGQLRHGRFTSPHLVDRWDCITRNNHDSTRMIPIDQETFQRLEVSYRQRDQALKINASDFEILTATAFESFKPLDVGVVEVGMGGRLDATNVFCQAITADNCAMPQIIFPPPLVTTITALGMDHQEFLGNTYADIAREKAGIMKTGVPAIFCDNRDYIDEELERHASATGARRFHFKKDLPTWMRLRHRDHSRYPRMRYVPDPVRRMNGNLAIASTLLALYRLSRIQAKEIVNHKIDADFKTLVEAWQSIAQKHVFPGRQEFISLKKITGEDTPVLLDGAHNEQGITALAATTRKLRTAPATEGAKGIKSLSISWVIAFSDSKDRDPKAILKPLLRAGDSVHVVEFGPVDGMPWVKPRSSKEVADVACKRAPGLIDVHYGHDLREALKLAAEAARQRGGPMVICGSLYLVGDVHRLLRHKNKV